MKRNPFLLLVFLLIVNLLNSCGHFKEDNLEFKEIEDKRQIEKFLKEIGVKKEFRDIETLAGYIYDVDSEKYGLYVLSCDKKEILGRYLSGQHSGNDYLSIYYSQYDGIARHLTVNLSKFKSDNINKNMYQKCFHIGYDTPDIYYMNEDDKKDENAIFEKKMSLRGFELSLFPVDEKITEEINILMRLSMDEIEITEGKSPPSPENMKRMLEDVLLRFQNCLE